MKKIDEQLVVALLSRDEQSACKSITDGADVNTLIHQKYAVETLEGAVLPLCHNRIDSALMLACRLDLNQVVQALLEHGANSKLIDNGKTFDEYRSRHNTVGIVKICKHQSYAEKNEPKMRAS